MEKVKNKFDFGLLVQSVLGTYAVSVFAFVIGGTQLLNLPYPMRYAIMWLVLLFLFGTVLHFIIPKNAARKQERLTALALWAAIMTFCVIFPLFAYRLKAHNLAFVWMSAATAMSVSLSVLMLKIHKAAFVLSCVFALGTALSAFRILFLVM